jgi:putative ABC transport system permease protein
MRGLRAWFNRLVGLVRKEQGEQEFAAEVESHLQMHIEENRRAGMSDEEARREALVKLGGVEATRQIYRERRGLPVVETVLRDFRFAARTLRKNPGFTAIAVVTLALGIGANIAIFSMVNALLLHPYNFPELDRLVRVWENRGIDEGADARFLAAQDAADIVEGAPVFEALTTYRCGDFNLTTDGNVQAVRGCRVTANFFDVLRVSPAVGRAFTTTEQAGDEQVAVVSYAFWQRRFAGDGALIGKEIQMNGKKYTIVGIMPRGFDYPVPMELWVPLALTPTEKSERGKLSLESLGRLKRGVSAARAQGAIESVSERLRRDYPATNANRRTEVLLLRKELYLYTLPLFVLLQAGAVFVLALACANLANLLFARIFGRQKEMALRTALGAGRWHLVRLLVTESVLLSVLAGGAALAVSFWSVEVLRASIAPSWTMWVPGWDGIHVDGTVLAFAVLQVGAVGLLLGLGTALHSDQIEPYATLKESGRGSMAGKTGRLRGALVVAQVVAALVLLVCAGLTAQGFLRLVDVYQGFRAENILRTEIRLPEKSYAKESQITDFYERLLRGSAGLPGASAAAVVTNSPASNVDNETTFFTIRGRATIKASEAPSADLQISSPEYFSVLRVPLVTGRVYSPADNADAARVAVISRSAAARYWPIGGELGQQIKVGAEDSKEPWMTVVGVVEDVRQNWWNPTSRPTIYEPFFQVPQRSMVFLMRVGSNPAGYAAGLREVVRGIDDQIALTGLGTLEREITDSIAIIRIMGVLMGLFGCVALVLASIGVYGVLTESVARRIPEIGVRLALGAKPGDVMRLVLGQAVKLAGIGLAIAVPIAFAVNRAVSSVLFGIVSVNPLLLASFTILLLLVALTAAYIPARRAMRVDPIVALRYE